MTEKRIYELAWLKAVDLWSIEAKYLEARPESELCIKREREAWLQIKDIELWMKEKEVGEF